MRKLIAFCLLFTACTTQEKIDSRIKIIATTAQIGDLVKEVGGELVVTDILIKGELDPHSYEIVKGDGSRLQKADIIFYNGLGLEHGASLSTYLHGEKKAIAVGDAVQKKFPERILKKEGVVDPHIWMDISLWMETVDPIVAELVAKDPEHAQEYTARGEALKVKLRDAHLRLYTKMQEVPQEKRYLVTSHDAFRYFTKSYLAEPHETNWAERFAAPEGLAPEGQLNAKDLQKIVHFLKSKQITVMFPESNISRDSIRKIADAGRELGLEIRVCREPLYGDAMGDQDYLAMMERNGETLCAQLK